MFRWTTGLLVWGMCILPATAAYSENLKLAGDPHPSRIYYTAGNSLSYVEVASADVTQVHTGPSAGRPMVPAVRGDTLYWSTYYPGRIHRSDLEGGGMEIVVDQGDTTTRAIEFHGGHVYWANESLGAIYRAPADFSSVEPVISGHTGYDGGIWDFAIYGGRFYWTSWDSRYVRSTALDGTDLQTIWVGARRAFSLEVADGRLFVGDTDNKLLLSTALDGSDRQVLVDNVNALGLEIFEGRLYFNNAYATKDIMSVPLSGGTPRYEATTDATSFQLTVVPEPSTLALACLAVVGLLGLAAIAQQARRR